MNTSLSRRDSLKTLASGFGYLAFASLSSFAKEKTSDLAPRAPHFPARVKRVIFLAMKGGPSHLDLFDYKPELNKRHGEYTAAGRAKYFGSPFAFEQYGQSGLWMSELWPHLSRHADDLCVINSMQTDLPNHPQAFAQMHTGSFQFRRPSLGAWTLYGLGTSNENLPGFITLNPPTGLGGAQNYGSAFLPAICQGTRIGGGQIPALYAALMKKDEEPGPPLKNINNRFLTKDVQRHQLDLIRRLNQAKLAQDQFNPAIEGAIESFELGFRMQDEVPEVLDIKSEPESIRKLYGIGQGMKNERFARQCLLARRLAEAGVRFIEITPPVDWDHHALLEQRLTENCAATDQPIAALLTDLKQRGLFEDTLVIWAGEFGRTPYGQLGSGRDHNNKGYTIWMSGGAVKGGLAYGATDEFGAKAVVNPVHIHDWHATILHLLGLDHTKLTYNYAGRDFRLTDVSGNVVRELLA